MKQLPLENEGYIVLLHNFTEWLDILGYSNSNVTAHTSHIKELFHWLEQKGILQIDHVNLDLINQYYSYLSSRSNQRKDGGLSKASLNKHQHAIRKFRTYLIKHGVRSFKVHLDVEKDFSKDTSVLTQNEVKELFKAIELTHAPLHIQQRDKAILVVLYNCGLRRNEAYHLNTNDILFDAKRLMVRQGKNYKERYVPINNFSLKILEEYALDGRFVFANKSTPEALFLNFRGGRLDGQTFGHRLKKLQGLSTDLDFKEKRLSAHTLRHSIATHLLQEGVKIEAISTFLGHSSLESTQIYTHLIKKVKPDDD